jgi:hypothetical protein
VRYILPWTFITVCRASRLCRAFSEDRTTATDFLIVSQVLCFTLVGFTASVLLSYRKRSHLVFRHSEFTYAIPRSNEGHQQGNMDKKVLKI